MGERGMSAGSGGPLSRTLPATSSRRPRTASPTGTVIGLPGRAHRHAAFQPGGRLKRDAAHGALVEMRLNLDDEGSGLIPFDDQGFFKPRKLGAVEGNVDHCSAYGEDLSPRLR